MLRVERSEMKDVKMPRYFVVIALPQIDQYASKCSLTHTLSSRCILEIERSELKVEINDAKIAKS